MILFGFCEKSTCYFIETLNKKNLKVFKWGCSEAITKTTTRRYSMGYSMNAMQNTDSMVKW